MFVDVETSMGAPPVETPLTPVLPDVLDGGDGVDGVAGTESAVQNLFNFGRHLVRAEHYRDLRVSAFAEWSRAVT
jgi:hypothetical protein